MAALLERVRHRLTIADYHKMGAAGVFGPTERVRLIEVAKSSLERDRQVKLLVYTR